MSRRAKCDTEGVLLPSVDAATQLFLRSTARLGRSIFNAAAASVFLVDGETGDLVFAAVSEERDLHLLGTRFPARTGIVGWVTEYCEPLLADDVSSAAQFDISVAETTGYVPSSILAAPLIRGENCIGVLEILDRDTGSDGELEDVALLVSLANQSAIALELSARLGSASLVADMAEGRLIADIARRISAAPNPRAERARKLLEVANDILAGNI